MRLIEVVKLNSVFLGISVHEKARIGSIDEFVADDAVPTARLSPRTE